MSLTIPTLQELTECDKSVFEIVLSIIEQYNLWCEADNILNKFAQCSINNKNDIKIIVEMYGNCVLHFLMHHLTSLVNYNASIELVACGLQYYGDIRYRHVWLCIDNGKVVVLCKSHETYGEIGEALSLGLRHQPSIDFPDSSHINIILCVESVPIHLLPRWNMFIDNCRMSSNVLNVTKDLFLHTSIMHDGVCYKTINFMDCVIIKMPWCIECDSVNFSIYFISNYDMWFFSKYSSDIDSQIYFMHEILK